MPFIQFQFRRGTSTEWSTSNPILAAGEIGIETNTNLFKIGNGTNNWNTLAYGGIQGTQGIQGIDGQSYNQGLQGLQGISGTGIQGTTGSGSQGTTGDTGLQGIQGIAGSGGEGNQGIQGITGSGSQGTTGTSIQGTEGSQGTTGTSIQGTTGSGSQGTTGSQGSTGTSIQGSTGTSIQGTTGDTGLQGIQGIQGSSVGSLPQNSISNSYTLQLTDAGKHLLHPSTDTTARTWIIPQTGNGVGQVDWPIGAVLTLINQNGAGVVTIQTTNDTMRLAVTGQTGDRTLAANGIATCIKLTSTEWIISGVGIS